MSAAIRPFPAPLSRAALFLIGCAIVLTPAAAAAATPLAGALTRERAVLSIVQALGIPPSAKTDASVRHLPQALQPFFTSALNRSALEVFGEKLEPQAPITRGQAVHFLTVLGNYHQKDAALPPYADVRRAEPGVRKAVDIALEYGWLPALRKDRFGVEAPFTARDLRTLLTVLRGEEVRKNGKTIVVPVVRVRIPSASDAPEAEKLLKNVLELLDSRYYYAEKFDRTEALYRAAEAIAESAHDPYTVFSKPSRADVNRTQLEGTLEGIGASVEIKKDTTGEEVLTVVAPLPGSPALAAGLQPGDEIVAVDGVSVLGMALEDAVGKIRGKSGTQVTLTLRRNGVEFQKTLQRARINLPEIERKTVGTARVVRLIQFGKITHEQFRQQMAEVAAEQPTGIVLDLRNNPGGFLDSAERVVSAFLPKNSVFATVKLADGSGEAQRTLLDPVVPESIPLVVLINNGSASASEIVAGALQDAGRARLVGEKTFGKGSVQQVYDVGGGATLKVTVAKWFTPKDRAIDGQGIEPDVRVPGSADRDDQLLRALDLLR